ncbi:InlB B-repeat-containing protein [Eggerthella sp. AM16-19]|uniref:InlB B-repeat-containing protein n=2 Tax=Coriobacteriia TaxID=84998 RepID=UPI001313F80A|nr:InlB B-repeat-containing protein [Eggerthella sp. AM16-19]
MAEPVDQLAGKYTVTGDGYCVSGKPVTLSVKLSDDVRDKFTFKGWYLGDSGVPVGTDPDHLELTPEQDTMVRAVFVPKRYRISVETDSRLVERGTVEIEGHPGADAVMVEYGSTATIKANPNEGFRFAHWKDGKRKKHPEQQLTVRVTGDQTYKAVFKGAEPEVVIAADTWLGGTVTCNGIEVTPATDSFSLGQTLHLKAEPKKGYFFWGWYVNGIFTSLDMECDVVAKGLTGKSERCTVTAAFKPYEVVCLPVASPADGGSVRASRVFTERGAEVALKAQASPMNVSAGEGYGSATGSGTYAAGEVACVSAVPAAGAHFIGWFSGGACLSTDAMYRFPVSADIDLEAVFGMGSFTVSIITASQSSILRGKAFLTSGNGLTSATKTCDKGDPFVAMAIPWSTYRFSHWIDERGAPVGFSPIIVRPAVANKTYTAYYVRDSWDVVAVDPRDGGYIYGSSENDEWGCALVGKVENGSSCTLRAVPDEGYVFDGWYAIGEDGAVSGEPLSTDAAWTFTPDADVTVTARFAEAPKFEAKPEPDPGPGPVDPDNPDPINPPEPGPNPDPDPDNPDPGPTPDPDNPDPDPGDPPNPPEPGPGPDPDNPDPGPGPDPANPIPNLVPATRTTRIRTIRATLATRITRTAPTVRRPAQVPPMLL